MNTFVRVGIVLLVCSVPLFGETWYVTNSGLTFNPSSLTINSGDTVVFSLTFQHNAVEVSQTTWNNDDSTPLDGGFSVPYGGGTVVLTEPGIHYYVCQPHATAGMKGRITVNPITDVRRESDLVPARFRLEQNYPNPFNPATSIDFAIPEQAVTEIAIYTVSGAKLRTLTSGTLAPGTYTVSWDGLDGNGIGVSSGVFYLRMTARGPSAGFTATRKLLLVR